MVEKRHWRSTKSVWIVDMRVCVTYPRFNVKVLFAQITHDGLSVQLKTLSKGYIQVGMVINCSVGKVLAINNCQANL